MKIFITPLMYMITIACTNPRSKESKFNIYCFDKNIPGYKLSTYDYDSSWINFLYTADIKKAVLVISDKEIENYDWEKQELNISAAILKKLEYLIAKNTWPVKFIVTLNDKRKYAGEYISRGSAMAIQHPVIHYDLKTAENNVDNKIRIYPLHSIQDLTQISLQIRSRTATDEIKNYFKGIRKLK